MIWLPLTIFIISCLVLSKSSAWVVEALTRMARFLKWKEFTVAFILMAFATSLPELFVGVTSALHQKPSLSFGNVIGSNIINLTLGIAVIAFLVKTLSCKSRFLQQTSLFTAIIGFLPVLLILDGNLSRIDGVILLSFLVFYLHKVFTEQEYFRKVFINHSQEEWRRFKLFLRDLLIFLGGLLLLLASSQGVVWSASDVAVSLGISLAVVGSVIVAVGTNLPEIVFTLRAVRTGHQDMALGNLMGSVVSNSTLVLGLTVLISPLKVVTFAPYVSGILFTVFTCFFFYVFFKTGKEITKKEAWVLLLVYLSFVILQLAS
ncbi:sodium:calcium antiporter [bacterium]|nr:sodium:calcium antiporter [bacterium]